MLSHLSAFTASLALLASLSNAAPLACVKRDLKFPFGSEKVRGVNLGGWFVLEPWITPSIFAQWSAENPPSVVDEFTYTQVLGKDEALARLQTHWDSWITRADFTAIKAAGFNHVRIPIGYWSIIPIDGEPFVQGAYNKFRDAIGWANEAGLNVMIDLHGGWKSQNGFDNSGKLGPIGWGTPETVNHTLSVLRILQDDFAADAAVTSIQLLNEPANWGINIETIKQFYRDGWDLVSHDQVAVSVHDAFMPLSYWNDFNLANLVLDTHHYEVFDNNQLQLDIQGHINSVCAFGDSMTTTGKVTINGEWTAAWTDCTLWLNGHGKGARWDGTLAGSSYIGSCEPYRTGSVAALSDTDKDSLGRWAQAQIEASEKAGGWIFWTWKTEGAPGWDMSDLLANGIIPTPVTTRKYPAQCA